MIGVTEQSVKELLDEIQKQIDMGKKKSDLQSQSNIFSIIGGRGLVKAQH